MVDGRNKLSMLNAVEMVRELGHIKTTGVEYRLFGDGHAAEKIVAALEKY